MHTAPLGPIAPISLPRASKFRVILRAIITNLPEILIINMVIWIAALTAILSFAGMFPGPLIGLPIFAILFGAPAVWASWQTIKLAMTPKDQSVPPPATPENE